MGQFGTLPLSRGTTMTINTHAYVLEYQDSQHDMSVHRVHLSRSINILRQTVVLLIEITSPKRNDWANGQRKMVKPARHATQA